MIEVIHEHSVEMSLLPAKANILDLGCLGFQFTRHFRGLGHNVKSVDIQELEDKDDYQMVAVSDFEGTAYIVMNSDKQAIKIQKNPKTNYEIACTTLKRLSQYYDISFWDLIKIDVEGSEYEIIMSLEKAPAKQLSVEFHMHCGQTLLQVNEMVATLVSLGYRPVTHVYTTMHGAGFNYWNSLFILK